MIQTRDAFARLPKIRGRWLASSVSAITIASSFSGAAYAQAVAPRDTAKPETGVEEIVVTAQKREQRLQDVPIAVTAISTSSLQVNRVTSVNDLTGLAPGLISKQNAGSLGSPSFAMRGVFASASAATQDREISMYLDGVYVGGNRGSVFDLPDLERIEVLRGPQGTLFGRNSTAGAINVVTRDPTGQLGAEQDFTVGNYGQFRTRTTVSSPQVGPFSAFVTFVHDQKRGDVRNLGAGTTFDRTNPFIDIGETSSPKWLGSHNTNSVFAALKFQPSDDFKATYKFDYSSGENTPEARAINVVNPASFVGNLLEQVIAAQSGTNPYGPVVFDPSNKRPDATNNAWNQPGFQRAYGHNLTAEWRISDNLSFKNIAAYRHTEAYGPSTIGGLEGLQFTPGAVPAYTQFAILSQYGAGFFSLPAATQAAITAGTTAFLNTKVGQYFAVYEGNSYGSGHQWSDEAQLNWQSRLLTVTLGGLWYHAYEADGGLPGFAPNFAFAPVAQQLPLGGLQNTSSKATSLAAYAQGELHLTPKLDIVAGGRVTKDKKIAGAAFGGTYVGTPTDGTLTGVSDTSTTFKKTKPTFSVGVNYKPTRDILVYGKYSTAFLSGGAVGPLTFKPETMESIEAGLKSEFWDHKLRLNVAVYQAHYEHSQSAQSGSNILDPSDPTHTRILSQYGVVVIDNGPLHAKGVEVETTVAPFEGVVFGGSVGYTDAHLTDPNVLATQGRGYKNVGAAKWAGSTYAQYTTQPIFDDASLLFRLDANYQGKYRNIPYTDVATATPAEAPYTFSKARWILNSRIALRDLKAGPLTAELGLWVKNLTNNKDALYTLAFGDFLVNSSYQPARTFGADLIFKFK